MLLIGSRAIKHWFPDFPRDPKDWDYVVANSTDQYYAIADDSFFENDSKYRVEYHVNPILFNLYQPGPFHEEIASANDLLTLKVSHLFWDIFWSKHMFDVQFLLKKGCKIDYDLFYKLYAYWQEYHGKNKRSDLKMSADDFFNNAMQKYDHDELHSLLVDHPAYFKVLKDGSEVEPDEHKFNCLSPQEKLDLVREEVYVMAYERLGGRDYREAYSWMLKKFIISHAPIWEALWIIHHYIELVKPHINYKTFLDEKIKQTGKGLKRQLSGEIGPYGY